ncbi:MAG: hypothetical protein RIE06_22885 [Roseibium album]|uniref:hypothetical protein n=1 Tax=Roseibium album TaxID=311410 RepID=UPI0032EFA849
MIKIFGPENPERIPVPRPDGTGFMAGEGAPVQADAKTLQDALGAYEQAYSVTIKPYDGSIPEVPLEAREEPKYFFYTRKNNERRLVDIHVFRNSSEICPKQDLLFVLEDSDIIRIGELVC